MNKGSQVFDFSPRTIPLRRAIWFIFGSAAVILLIFAGRNALVGSEGELAEALRRMFLGEDIFSPDCRWHPEERSYLWLCRFRIYAMEIFGQNEFACRFPSAISALAVLGGTMVLARDFFNRKVEYCTAWLLAGSYGFIYWGRFAGSFMALTAWCVWSVVWLRNARCHFWWRGIFFILLLAGCVWWGWNYVLLLPGMLLITRESFGKALISWHSLYALLFSSVVVLALLMFAIHAENVSITGNFFRVWQMIQCSWVESFRICVWPGSSFSWYGALLNLPRLLLPLADGAYWRHAGPRAALRTIATCASLPCATARPPSAPTAPRRRDCASAANAAATAIVKIMSLFMVFSPCWFK